MISNWQHISTAHSAHVYLKKKTITFVFLTLENCNYITQFNISDLIVEQTVISFSQRSSYLC